LLDARQVKHLPGRPKTDREDAIWLAKVAERGMATPSFVPPKPIRRLRDLTRYRRGLIQDRTRNKQRLEKTLEDAQIKLSSVISDLHGVSGRAMIEALIGRQRDPKALAELIGMVRGPPGVMVHADATLGDLAAVPRSAYQYSSAGLFTLVERSGAAGGDHGPYPVWRHDHRPSEAVLRVDSGMLERPISRLHSPGVATGSRLARRGMDSEHESPGGTVQPGGPTVTLGN